MKRGRKNNLKRKKDKIREIAVVISIVILIFLFCFLLKSFLNDAYHEGYSQTNLSYSSPGYIKDDIKTISNLEYSNVNSPPLLLDLYLPLNSSFKKLPVIILVHGGGWDGGMKEDLSSVALEVAKHGYATVSVDYSWSSKSKFPKQIEDLNASVLWIKQHAEEYNLDKEKIGLIGFSAGGHLASLLAVQSRDIKAVVSCWGPQNLKTLILQCDKSIYCINNTQLLKEITLMFLGCDITSDNVTCINLAKQASPQYHINQIKTTTSFLLIHGDKDEIVPINQSIDFNNVLKQRGIDSTLIIKENLSHGNINDASIDTIDKFFKEKLS
ncbi:MAG: alpha/beta hydrolase [Candidatus Pacearchaeota archaeon]|jgi:acetyl esterase/lipase